MRYFLSLTAATLLSFAGAPAQAEIYNVTGTFGADITGTTGLAGGSFVATYQTEGLPTSTFINDVDNYSVSVFDASGSLVSTFGDPTGASGNIFDLGTISPFPVSYLVFGDPGSHAYLGVEVLDGPSGFDGTGAVIPTDMAIGPFASLYRDPSGDAQVSITSGYATAASAVPEPSSLILAGVGGLTVAGFRARRRRAGAAA